MGPSPQGSAPALDGDRVASPAGDGPWSLHDRSGALQVAAAEGDDVGSGGEEAHPDEPCRGKPVRLGCGKGAMCRNGDVARSH